MKIINLSELTKNQHDNLIFNARGLWDAKWISHKTASPAKSGVYGYFLKFTLPKAQTIKVHLSADNRYKFYVDGEFEGFGPERGDNENWFFETYKLKLSKGSHTFFAFTWAISVDDNRSCAQYSYRPAFILTTEDMPQETVNTGFAPWKVIDLSKYYKTEKTSEPLNNWYIGNRQRFHGKGFPIGYEKGDIGNWDTPVSIALGEQKINRMAGDIYTRWWLRPALLPIEFTSTLKGASVRYAEKDKTYRENSVINLSESHSPSAKKIQKLFDGETVTFPKNTKIKAIVDLNNYYCVYIKTKTEKGDHSKIYLNFAEGLYEQNPQVNHKWDLETLSKGNRDEIDNKIFQGYGDKIFPGGGKDEEFESPWWISGRYVEFYVETKDEALTLSLELTECHFDYKWQGDFKCPDKKYTDIIPIAKRSLEMCTHETYMDCPYYEQLMYVGDTRVEALATYTWERDRYIQKKALDSFHMSIHDLGITQSRYPSYKTQHIPSFSLWYIAMLYDYAMWGDDLEFVKKLLPDTHGIIEFFLGNLNEENLLVSPKGWNFLDWTVGFKNGMTPNHDKGISGQYNIHLVYTLDILSKLEDILNEPLLAKRHREIGDRIYKSVIKTFWDSKKGMFADDKEKTTFLEHTQCLAVLSDHAEDKTEKMMKAVLKEDKNIYRTTIYYSFYLHEAAKKSGYFDIFKDKILFWSNLKNQGFKTTPECPEPARSDCHAWGAHPLYHLQTGILGVTPNEPCFKSVKIKPNLLDLEKVSGTVPHKLGDIKIDLKQDKDNRVKGTVTLPEGLTGVFEYEGKTIALKQGKNII